MYWRVYNIGDHRGMANFSVSHLNIQEKVCKMQWMIFSTAAWRVGMKIKAK
jgi:hypothetical protein